MRIVGGSRRGRKISAPRGRDLRPTSERAREALFNILQHRDLPAAPLAGATIMDLFAGTGALGLEALSRGAGELYAIERDREALKHLRHNVHELDFDDEVTVIEGDATWFRKPGITEHRCDYAFLDPPYGENLVARTLRALAESDWLADQAVVIVEMGRQDEFAPPDEYAVLEDRRYGSARIVLLGWSAPKF